MSIFALLSSALHAGCSEGTRIAHYRAGGAYFGGAPAPSPDGNAIVYSSPRSGNGDLYRVSIDGTSTVQLTSNADYEGEAAYSLDGKQIVFIREGDLVWLKKGTEHSSTTKTGCMMAVYIETRENEL